MLTKQEELLWRVRYRRDTGYAVTTEDIDDLCDIVMAHISQPKDAKCPECNDAYSEVCPVCQLDGHPVVEKLRAELNALKQPKDANRPAFMHPDDIDANVADSPKMTADHIRELQAYISQPPRSEVSNG